MGVAGMLSKQKLILLSFISSSLVLLLLIGCKETMVNYDNLLEKPFVVNKGNYFEIHLGYTAASANWIKPSISFEGDMLYVSGVLTFKESPKTVTVQLPEPTKKYYVFWLDEGGKKTELTVREQ